MAQSAERGRDVAREQSGKRERERESNCLLYFCVYESSDWCVAPSGEFPLNHHFQWNITRGSKRASGELALTNWRRAVWRKKHHSCFACWVFPLPETATAAAAAMYCPVCSFWAALQVPGGCGMGGCCWACRLGLTTAGRLPTAGVG